MAESVGIWYTLLRGRTILEYAFYLDTGVVCPIIFVNILDKSISWNMGIKSLYSRGKYVTLTSQRIFREE